MTARLTRMPRHLRLNPPRLHLLRRWAGIISARYQAHVYLVGSACRDDNADPRDWDVRVPLTYDQFALRYATAAQRRQLTGREIAQLWERQYYGTAGDDRNIYHKWWRESQATGKEAFHKYLHLYTDFQAYPPHEWRNWMPAHSKRVYPYWRIV